VLSLVLLTQAAVLRVDSAPKAVASTSDDGTPTTDQQVQTATDADDLLFGVPVAVEEGYSE